MGDLLRFDVLVIGAGPAGVAAAVAAAEAGARVGLVDDQPAPGGRIWRGAHPARPPAKARAWLERLERSGTEVLARSRVLDVPAPHQLLVERPSGAALIGYAKLVLAAGGRELFLPFPGWTLPNVHGAGGLQALVAGGFPVADRRVVVAGTGPLLWEVAASLREAGATIAAVAEQAPRGRVLGFGLGLWRHPGRLAQASRLRRRLAGVPILTGCWPVRAAGAQRLESITLARGDRTWTEACDHLACAFGLVPNVELAVLLGCVVRGDAVHADPWQQTSRAGVFCAGEMAGVGGAELALVEGLIAGHAAAGRPERARALFGRRRRERSFAQRLGRAFGLRPEVRALAEPDTMVCRCEDVTHGALASYGTWREAKLQTRCGMGPCQGRVCGAAARVLYGWGPSGVRPPLYPAAVGALATPPEPPAPPPREQTKP